MEDRTKIPQIVAEEDFFRMLKAARLKPHKFDKKFGEDADETKDDIIEAIMDGEMTVGEDGFPTFIPYTDNETLSELKFKRRLYGRDMDPVYNAKKTMDGWYKAIGDYFGVKPSDIKDDMETGDIMFLQTLWTIFLRR